MESRLNITQVPVGSSKKDFKINPARSLINNKIHIQNCHTPNNGPKVFHDGPTQSPDVRGNPSPNYMVGQGYETKFLSLKAVKEESVRGVFTKTNRQFVKESHHSIHGTNPPTFDAYLSNGEIPTKLSVASVHTVSGCIPKSPANKSPFINRNPLLNTQSGFGFQDEHSRDSQNASVIESNKRRNEEAQRIIQNSKKIFT